MFFEFIDYVLSTVLIIITPFKKYIKANKLFKKIKNTVSKFMPALV